MKIRLSITVALLLLFAGARTARPDEETPKNLLDKLVALNQEATSIKEQHDTAVAERASLATEEKRLSDTADLLKGAIQHYVEDQSKHDNEVADHVSQKAAHDANPCTYPEGHPEKCDSYNAEADRLDTWARRLNEELKTLDFRHKGLNEARENLNKGVLDWASRNKGNNAKLLDLESKEKAVVEKTRRLTIDDGFLRVPKLKKLLSEHCAKISEIDTDAALEAASQCLQRVFDGASH